jgi:hypothetical protein
MQDKLLVFDSDTAVYACCFIAEKKIHYAIVDGEIVYQVDNKNKYNKWFKEQKDFKPEDITYDMTEDLLPFSECAMAIDLQIKDLLDLSGCRRKALLLTKGGGDFRTHLATIKKYKGNREGTPKPKYYAKMRTYLQTKYKAKMYHKWEADDAAAMSLHAATFKTDKVVILAAVDKDLEQCVGLHVHPNKRAEGVYLVDEFDGAYSFYKQMLMGDAADNIPGLKGVGDVKAGKLLAGFTEVEELEEAVWFAYLEHYGETHTYTPWWWSDEKYDAPDYFDAAFVASKRAQFPDKEVTVPTHAVFREVANLLHMLRTPTDQYQPTTPELKALIEPYTNGVVKHFLGE